MAKVLVTGASGFMGAHLVERLLAAGDDVQCLVRGTSNTQHLETLGARLVYGDVKAPETLPSAVQGVDVVYHLAGLTKALRSEDLFLVNEDGVCNLLVACAHREKRPVVVLVSSLAAAGPSTVDRPRCESDPAQPVSNYGRSKRAGEVAALEFAKRVPITIVRPPIVFGEGDTSGTLAWFKTIARLGVHFTPGLGRNRFSLVHVADLVAGLMLVAERGARLSADRNATAGIYFIAGDEQPTYAELGQLIGAAVGRRTVRNCPTPIRVAAFVAEAIGQMRGRPLALNFDKAREARAGSWMCTSAAAREQLGFRVAAPLDERLRQTAAWYRQHTWL